MKYNPYNKGFRMILMSSGIWPKNLTQLFWFCYGFDVFYGPFPMFKILFAVNIVIWIALFLSR